MATGQAPRTTAASDSIEDTALLRLPRIRHADRSDWTQLVRFCVVGASGYVVNLVVFSLAVHLLGAHHLTAGVLAFCVAWLNNFVLNRHWTFHNQERSALSQGARYLAVSLLALAINLILLEAFVRAGIPEVPSQAAAILLVTPVAFLLNRRWAFQ